MARPSNPTGTVLTERELFALHDWCAGYGRKSKTKAWFVSDEIYHQIEYGAERARTALEAPKAKTENVALVINSFSKYHCLTGWRVGWCVVPPALRGAMTALQQNLFINAPHISQIAAAASLELECGTRAGRARRASSARTAACCSRVCRTRGSPSSAPRAGRTTCNADVSHLTKDSVALCARILKTAGVAIVPGSDFDRERGRSCGFPSAGTSRRREMRRPKALVATRREWDVRAVIASCIYEGY